MTYILGPDGQPVSSQQEVSVPSAGLRGASLPANPSIADAYGALDPGLRGGWTYADGLGRPSLRPGRYGVNRDAERYKCRSMYHLNPLLWGAVQIAVSFLVGDAFSYGEVYDKAARVALEEFWQANNLGTLISERWMPEFFLDGEQATVWPTGGDDPGADAPARIAFLDLDAGVRVEGDTALGTVAADMVSALHLRQGMRERTWLRGEFVWTASDALHNDPRGLPLVRGAADAAMAYIALANNRLNIHEIQQRIVGVYTAILNPEEPDGGDAKWRAKGGAFRHIPPKGAVVPLITRPGYTDAKGNRYDGVTEKLEFPRPASGASDAKEDMRVFLRIVGLCLGGLPEHWLGEGGSVNRACYSADTETLTVDGWKHYSEIDEDTLIAQYNPQTGQAEWVPAGPLYLYPYKGEMLHFKNSVLDIMVTPDHRMYGKRDRDKAEHKAYEIIQAQDIRTNKWSFLNAAPFQGAIEQASFTLPAVPTGSSRAVYPSVTLPMDTWLAFLGYWISEGSANIIHGTYRITVSQKKTASAQRIRQIIQAMPEFAFVESQSTDGTYRWAVADKGLCLWLMEHCGVGAREMRLPALAKHLSARQATILFEALMDGDGTWDRKRGYPSCGVYYSCSKQLIDDVQLLAMSLGHRANVNYNSMEAARVYRLQLTRDRRESMFQANQNIHPIPYDGLVYCYSVPSGIFITRRNGKVAIQGNTASEMSTPAVTLGLRRQATLRSYLDRTMRTELRRRYGPERRYRVPYSKVSKDGLSRSTGYRNVTAELLEFPWTLPRLDDDSLDTLLRVVTTMADRGWLSDQTAAGRLGADVPSEIELMAAAGRSFGQARVNVAPPGGDANAPGNQDPAAGANAP